MQATQAIQAAGLNGQVKGEKGCEGEAASSRRILQASRLERGLSIGNDIFQQTTLTPRRAWIGKDREGKGSCRTGSPKRAGKWEMRLG
jgi:hypothetical protein